MLCRYGNSEANVTLGWKNCDRNDFHDRDCLAIFGVPGAGNELTSYWFWQPPVVVYPVARRPVDLLRDRFNHPRHGQMSQPRVPAPPQVMPAPAMFSCGRFLSTVSISATPGFLGGGNGGVAIDAVCVELCHIHGRAFAGQFRSNAVHSGSTGIVGRHTSVNTPAHLLMTLRSLVGCLLPWSRSTELKVGTAWSNNFVDEFPCNSFQESRWLDSCGGAHHQTGRNSGVGA